MIVDGDEGWEEISEDVLELSAAEELIHLVEDTTSEPVVT